MPIPRSLTALVFVLFLQGAALAQTPPWNGGRPDSHAPIGVMGDHTHERGEAMLSYRFMHMDMDGNRIGTAQVDSSAIVSSSGSNFLVTPLRMPMNMQMAGVMFAPSDRVTLMAMVPYSSMSMDHVTRAGGTFTTESSGIGDISATALVRLVSFGRQRLHLNAGIQFPSGSTTRKDVTPASAPNAAILPYPMQPGSGTVSFQPGLTYLAQSDNWSGGGQIRGTIRTGTNDQDYRLGNRLMSTAWVAHRLNARISVSGRVEDNVWGNIDGANPAFSGAVASRMVPTVFPDLRGGDRIDAGPGINILVGGSRPSQARVALEFLTPVYQRLDGPQLEQDFSIVAGAQFTFY